ncbi:MAG: BREX-6 system phosphatase PglZ [Nannocystaceae bacterium]
MPPTLAAHPVSTTLEHMLLDELRRHPIVIWLDRDDLYSDFVDELSTRTAPEPFAASVVGHRGSYLETMLRLAPLTDGLDAPALLVHVPKANEESIKDTPLLELYDPGYRFRIALDTLIRKAAAGRVPPDEVDAFLGTGTPTLPEADAWMATKVAAASGELTSMLQGLRPTELLDDLTTGARVATMLEDPGSRAQVWHYLASHLGLRDGWPFPRGREQVTDARDVADAMISWAMCVEFAHDLRRPTHAEVLDGLRELSPPLVEACRGVAPHARRSRHVDYATLALEVERLIEDERTQGTAADLGKIDTFHFEEEQLYEAAVLALTERRYAQARQWADDRLQGRSYWVERDANRKSAWILVQTAAGLGLAVGACTLDLTRVGSLSDATERYAEQGAAVDRLHRQLEQAREARLYRKVPRYEQLQAALNVARDDHWQWADALAREWSDLCQREGALPGAEYQQRGIFEQVVRPLLRDDVKTALLLVDGMRFEMAQELVELLGTLPGTAVRLRPRLAELPSVTEVGMNVLAPVAEGGKLRPELDAKSRRFSGFHAPGYLVSTRDKRRETMARRAGGATCPSRELPELLDMTRAEIRSFAAKARLVIVISDEIDASGEKGVGPAVFAGAIRKLHKAWKLLRDAGVRRFVITSDHGFLLRTPERPVLTHGSYHDALSRYALVANGVASDEQLSVSLRSLGYEGVTEHLALPRGLEVYRAGADRTYVHGGNAPAERVIPVLTLEHKHDPGADDLSYRVRIVATSVVDDMHCVQARVESEAQRGLSFAEADDVDLDLRVVGADDVERHLVGARGGARLDGELARARVGASFELMFRLTGPRSARVPVELYHPSGTHTVTAQRTEVRFDVEVPAAARVAAPAPTPASAPAPTPAPMPTPAAEAEWLQVYDDPGVRKVFAHLQRYGTINAPDATAMLGSQRKFRRFSNRFDELVKRAPFVVRIEFAGTTKLYIKESDRHE